MLWGAYDHATVICGYTPDRLLLFDSYGFQWLAKRCVGLDNGRSAKRHLIAKHSVMALRVVPAR